MAIHNGDVLRSPRVDCSSDFSGEGVMVGCIVDPSETPSVSATYAGTQSGFNID